MPNTYGQTFQKKGFYFAIAGSLIIALCGYFLSSGAGEYPKSWRLNLGYLPILLTLFAGFLGKKENFKWPAATLALLGLVAICGMFWDVCGIYFKSTEEEWKFLIGQGEFDHRFYFLPGIISAFICGTFFWAVCAPFFKTFDKLDLILAKVEKYIVVGLLMFMIFGYVYHIGLRWIASDILPMVEKMLGTEIKKPPA